MESAQTIQKKDHHIQKEIIRFRASTNLREHLTNLAHEEELSLAALVRRLIIERLEQFHPITLVRNKNI